MTDEDFHLGAEVRSSDGREVGRLVHLLVGSDYSLKALVIKESASFSGHRLAPLTMLVADEFIAPKDAVTSMTRERVDLGLTAAEVRLLPPYIAYRERDESTSDVLADTAGPLTASPEVPHWLEQVANKPADELEIDGGENVMLGRTGQRLGTVKDVLFDGDQLVGVVLLPDGLFKHEVLLPRRFLDRSDDLALFANVSGAEVESLTPFHPAD